MEVFLGSLATEEYESMASSLIDMGATNKDVDVQAFSRDLEKIFLSIQDLDTEIIVATARETNTNATAVYANVVVDERQMNALFLDVVNSYVLSSSVYLAPSHRAVLSYVEHHNKVAILCFRPQLLHLNSPIPNFLT
ncbi:ABC1 domain-containing protein [Forsythia ovata]|uniref:ABC1 domain-containing protein n=1 Tax=Forsythia ovata TaxID=205694 RepID=A0ABD1X9S6_9LAMI